jgi:hypothetical protein
MFISKLMHAVNNHEGAYQYATQAMKVKLKDLSYQQFIALPFTEHNALISTMLSNIHQNPDNYEILSYVVEAAEACGAFKNICFGPLPESVADLLIPLS